MAVARHEPIAVVDLDHFAVAAAPAGDGHGARGGGADWIAGVAAIIGPGMHRRLADNWSGANAEWRALVDVAGDRLAQWHFRQRAAQRGGVGASRIDPQ